MKAIGAALLLVIVLAPAGFAVEDELVKNLVAMPEEGSPFIAFRIWIKAGSQNDPAGREGLASLTADILANGSTTEHRYEEILELLYPMAAGYRASVDKEMTVFSGTVHRDNLPHYAELFKQAILFPAFSEEDFKRVKTQTLNFLERGRRFSSDEELGKELLFREIFRGTPYEAPEEGYVKSVGAITLEDVKRFYKTHYTRENIVIGIGGGFPGGFGERLLADFQKLPEGKPESVSEAKPKGVEGMHVLIVEKNTSATAISFGFPIALLRSDPDFYSMFLANSWLGEHRHSASHLYQVIRETRGMNYGDYSYIEAWPMGHRSNMPPLNVARRQQIFQIWIRPVKNHQVLFAFRAALRELKRLVGDGLTLKEFEDTRKFLHNYTVNYGSTVSRRLGYRLDDLYYGLDGGGYLERIRLELKGLTLEGVNAAVRNHLQYENMWVVFITKDAEALKEALISGEPSPITYPEPTPQEVLDEDKEIESFPFSVKPENIRIININEVLEN